MDPITIAAIALGGLAFIGSGKPKPKVNGGFAVKGKADRVAMLNEIRNMAFYYSNTFDSMPYLADFLTVIAFRESNFNPEPIHTKQSDRMTARGLFGMRPDYMFKKDNGLEYMKSNPNALLNPRWSFVIAVYHIFDACRTFNHDLGSDANFAAVRRWWMFPHLLDDVNYESSSSKDNLKRLEKAIYDCNYYYGTKIDPEFIWKPINGWKNYPGMDVMLKIYGLK